MSIQIFGDGSVYPHDPADDTRSTGGAAIAQTDWDAKEGEPGHIKGRTHWVEQGKEVLEETELVAGGDKQFGIPNPAKAEIVLGEHYTVNFNGVEYNSTAYEGSKFGMSAFNVLINDSTDMDTGEGVVFVIGVDDKEDEGIYGVAQVYDGSTSVTLSIRTAEVVHKLPNKFLNLEWIPTKQVVENDIFPMQSAMVSEHSRMEPTEGYILYMTETVVVAPGASITNGQVLLAEVDGTTCELVVGHPFDENEGITYLAAGDKDGTYGVTHPFAFMYMRMDSNEGWAFLHRDFGEHTIRLWAASEAVDKLPGKFLPEGVPYSEGGMVEILPECQPTYDEEDSSFFISEAIEGVEIGKKYTISWNGKDYNCTAIDGAALGSEGVVVFGDVYTASDGQVGSASTGEPFVMMIIPAEKIAEIGFGAMIMPLDGSTTLTISIYHNSEIIHKLDNKFLDMEWIPEVDKTELIAPQKTSTGTKLETDFIGTAGEKVAVYFEGVRLPGVVGTDGETTWITPRGAFGGEKAYGDYFVAVITPYPQMPEYTQKSNFYIIYTEADGWCVEGTTADEFTIAVYKETAEAIPQAVMPEGIVASPLQHVHTYKTNTLSASMFNVQENGSYMYPTIHVNLIPSDAVYCITIPEASCRLAAITANVRMGNWDTNHIQIIADKEPTEDVTMTILFYALS